MAILVAVLVWDDFGGLDARLDDLLGDAALMDGALRGAFLKLFPLVERARLEQPRGYWFLASPLTPYPQFCGVWAGASERDDIACAAALEAAVLEIEALGLPFSLQLREGRAPRVERRAAELGLAQVEEIEGMLVRPAEVFEPPGAELEIRAVKEDEFDVALGIAARGFQVPVDLFRPVYTSAVMASVGISCYLGCVGGEAVATAVCVRGEKCAGIFNVATPPEHRRHGYASQLVTHALQRAFDTGARFGYLQASPMGSGVYRRLGFHTVEHYRILTRPA